jgi:GDP-4-dehydro-6-deoxy-D-mannose reductase
VPSSYDRPLHTLDINARGALMVMNSAQDAGVKGILQISSAEIYGDLDNVINEESQARPHSTYGATKLAIDAIVQTRWREAESPTIALRQFNCLGERDVLHPYVVPEIYRQALASDYVYLGNNSYRDFIYAGDAVRMAVELLEKGNFGEVYNLGSEEGIKIYDLAKMIGIFMGKDLRVEEDPKRKRAWEIWHLQSDNKKIYDVIEARPKFTLEQAVKSTIEYYKSNPDKWAF